MHVDAQTLMIIVVVGIVVGGLGVVAGGRDFLTYIIFGIVGAFIGDYVSAAVNIQVSTVGQFAGRALACAIGAIVLVIVARLILRA